MIRLALLCLLLAAPAAAQAQTPPEGLAWIAVRDLNGVHDNDMEPLNRPPLLSEPPAGMIRAVPDLNGDGVADWLIDYEAAEQAHWCGTGGCLKRLYVSTPDGLTQVLAAQAFSLSFDAGEVTARLHHTYCSLTGPGDCRIRMRLEGDRLVPAEGAEFDPLEAASGA